MTKSVLMLIVLMVATSAFAGQTKPGSQCGLTDGYDSDSFEDVGTLTSVYPGAKLTKLQAKQIVAAAKKLAGGEDVGEIASLKSAIETLMESSEARDVYVGNQRVNGQVVTTVTYFPGGNPVGVIFKKGTTQAIAEIQDSSVVCK